MTRASETANYLADLAGRGARCAGLPAGLEPADRRAAYAAQALVETRSAKPLHGWKIAATSLAGQKHIGVDGPLAGRYVAERVVRSGGTVPFGTNHMKVAEVEFGFRFARDVPPRQEPYTESEVLEAVASLHPMIEIPDSRYDRFEIVGAPALIADNACAHWLVEGEAMPERWRSIDLRNFKPVGRVSGGPEVTGLGSNVLGSPVTALTWLVNELSALDLTLRKGEIVSTGTCLVPMAIKAGDHVVGGFGELGQVSVSLA